MIPAEHYAEAERLLITAANELSIDKARGDVINRQAEDPS